MGNLCSRDEPIRKTKAETVELRNDIARPEENRGETEAITQVRRATTGSGSRASGQVPPTTGSSSRAVGNGGKCAGTRNFRVLEELEARKRKTRKAERDRA
ncbi:hypothetical protein HOY82DRAFT_600845 [Tuber indicum]|nr:hypothetical protein HOY82DRAFT_600845 [Tuber indicum]